MADEDGWRRNPVVLAVLALIVLISLCFVVTRVACTGGEKEPLSGDAVTLICPHDNHVFRVPRAQLGLDADADADQVQAKIVDVACPKCGKKDCVLPVYCLACGKPFAPPKTAVKVKEFKCPHCGKSPWGR